MVGTPGLEPGRLIQPTDFKSVVFTNFTMPPTAMVSPNLYNAKPLGVKENYVKY